MINVESVFDLSVNMLAILNYICLALKIETLNAEKFNLKSIFKSCFLKKKHLLYTLKTCSKIHFGRPIQVVPCILGQLHFWIHLLASIQLKKGQFLYVNFPSSQWNLIKTFHYEANTLLITNNALKIYYVVQGLLEEFFNPCVVTYF